MENFKSKFVTAEAAIAAAVKDGDWVDYGFGGGYPELLDKALAARKGHLKDLKVLGVVGRFIFTIGGAGSFSPLSSAAVSRGRISSTSPTMP